jgi:phosphatidylethanolamine-binding protein (PEBP) family uncharacterized protein
LWYGISSAFVSYGNNIPVEAVKTVPSFLIAPLVAADEIEPTRTIASSKNYTLVLSDPDATSRAHPVKGQMCHWIHTGINLGPMNVFELDGTPGYLVPTSEILARDLVEYLPPGPPPSTGKHRYVFVLLEPKDSDKDLVKPKDRPRWGYENQGSGVMDWAEDNGLIPVGANFFYSQNSKQ